jgi:hypothetical protein
MLRRCLARILLVSEFESEYLINSDLKPLRIDTIYQGHAIELSYPLSYPTHTAVLHIVNGTLEVRQG